MVQWVGVQVQEPGSRVWASVFSVEWGRISRRNTWANPCVFVEQDRHCPECLLLLSGFLETRSQSQ